MNKFFIIFSSLLLTQEAFANQPVEWQLGFQNAASQSMREIVSFHNYLLLPIIIAISVFVLFLMLYACVRFRASANPNPSKRTHNVAVEVLWTLIPCLILIVMAVPSFKILYKQDAIPKADLTIKASRSDSYHILRAPAAPAPIDTSNIPIIASLVETIFGAVSNPTAQVNITSDITLGFINLNNSEKLNKSSWDRLSFFNFELLINFKALNFSYEIFLFLDRLQILVIPQKYGNLVGMEQSILKLLLPRPKGSELQFFFLQKHKSN